MPIQSLIEEQFLNKLCGIIEANISNEHFGVSELAKAMGMSRSNLHRKLSSITKASISQFIRQCRLKLAMKMLKETTLTVSEVAFNVGFGSVTYFTKCFHDFYGIPPGKAGNYKIEEEENGQIADGNCSVCGKSVQEVRDFSKQIIKVESGINKKRLRKVLFLFSFFLIILIVFLYFSFKPFSDERVSFEKSIAVLPFVDNSSEGMNAYLIDGINDEIEINFEKVKEFAVKSPTEVEKYRESKLSIREIAKGLKVNYILSGSGLKIQNRIRIRLELMEVNSGNEIWSKSYQHDVDDKNIFEIQEELALSIVNELKGVIVDDIKSR